MFLLTKRVVWALISSTTMSDDADTSMEGPEGDQGFRGGGIIWTSTQTGTETINDILKYSSSELCLGRSLDEKTHEVVESCWVTTARPPRRAQKSLCHSLLSGVRYFFRPVRSSLICL